MLHADLLNAATATQRSGNVIEGVAEDLPNAGLGKRSRRSCATVLDMHARAIAIDGRITRQPPLFAAGING